MSGMSDMPMGDMRSPAMAAHMHLTPRRPVAPGDSARAKAIVRELADAIGKYHDYHVALDDGFRIFLPNVPQQIYHFTSRTNALRAAFGFDAQRPTSLLYRKTASGYELVGAMYTAPYRTSLADLDARVPLSIAQWHVHTNICLPPSRDRRAASAGRDGTPRFGPLGSITTDAACAAAGGTFHAHIFGWMVHVEPWAAPGDVWGANTRHID